MALILQYILIGTLEECSVCFLSWLARPSMWILSPLPDKVEPKRRKFVRFDSLIAIPWSLNLPLSPPVAAPGSLPQNSSSPSSLSRQTNGLSTSTCAVSFSPELTNPTTTTIPGQTNSPPGSSASLSGVDPTPNGPSPPRVTKRDLLNQLSLSDKESSALYMTEVADSCVQAMRGTSGLRGEVLHPGGESL